MDARQTEVEMMVLPSDARFQYTGSERASLGKGL